MNIPKLFEWLCKLSIALADIDEYLKGILRQILASYKILTELNDGPDDLDTMENLRILNYGGMMETLILN